MVFMIKPQLTRILKGQPFVNKEEFVRKPPSLLPCQLLSLFLFLSFYFNPVENLSLICVNFLCCFSELQYVQSAEHKLVSGL